MGHATKAGRNDLCPCGSGRKFKKCCEKKRRGARLGTAMLLTVAGAIIGALLLGLASLNDDSAASGPGPGRVWSPEHGHWHDR